MFVKQENQNNVIHSMKKYIYMYTSVNGNLSRRKKIVKNKVTKIITVSTVTPPKVGTYMLIKRLSIHTNQNETKLHVF